MSLLRLGLAGLGHGSTVLGANDADTPISVTAVCDTDEARLEDVARQYGIGAATTDFDELISMPDLDIIGIYSPARFTPSRYLPRSTRASTSWLRSPWCTASKRQNGSWRLWTGRG